MLISIKGSHMKEKWYYLYVILEERARIDG